MEVSRSFSPGSYIPGKKASGTHWIRGWVAPFIFPAGSRLPVIQTVAQSLYWLSYVVSQSGNLNIIVYKSI
jgi:hypothetical protein